MKNKVFLDPGHGGEDIGYVYEELVEKELSLNIAMYCRDILQESNIEVEMSRENDEYISLEERIDNSNFFNSNLFISIHCNSGGGDRGEIIYSLNDSKSYSLAKLISKEMVLIGQRAIKIYNCVNVDESDYHAVIRETICPSVLVKCAYIDNDLNKELISSTDGQMKFAQAISKAIINYLDEEEKEEL